MMRYSTPQQVQATGRRLWGTNKVTLATLQGLLKPGEMLIAYFEKYGEIATVAIEETGDVEELYKSYMSGGLVSLWYYAMPNIEVFHVDFN